MLRPRPGGDHRRAGGADRLRAPAGRRIRPDSAAQIGAPVTIRSEAVALTRCARDPSGERTPVHPGVSPITCAQAVLEIDRGGYDCDSLLMSATVDSFLDEYARRYTERDVEGVTNLCLWPFLAIRNGEAIHLPDHDAVRDHFATAIRLIALRRTLRSGRRSRSTPANSVSAPSSRPSTGMRSTRTGASSETPGRATSCSPLRTGGAFSRTRISCRPRRVGRRSLFNSEHSHTRHAVAHDTR